MNKKKRKKKKKKKVCPGITYYYYYYHCLKVNIVNFIAFYVPLLYIININLFVNETET